MIVSRTLGPVWSLFFLNDPCDVIIIRFHFPNMMCTHPFTRVVSGSGGIEDSEYKHLVR